jgi:hypothetical protein
MSAKGSSEPVPEAARALAAAQALMMEDATAQVVTALRERGVRCILLKGPSLARWLYSHSEVRGSRDVDLLVDPAGFANAERVLGQLGFSRFPVAGVEHADTWLRGEEDPLVIELHRTLDGVHVDADQAWSVLSRSTAAMSVGGVSLEVLGEPARALHVALHAAQHGKEARKPLNDLTRAVEQVDLLTWRHARGLADSLDAEEAMAAGLRLLPEGHRLAEDLGLSQGVGARTVLMSESPPPLAPGLARVAEAPGVVGKLRLLLRKLFPAPAYMRLWSGLARRGPLGLALTYVLRPLWVLWRAVPAIRAWRSARRQARARSSSG